MTTQAYIARCQGCNQVVAATIDNPNRIKDIARQVGRWIREGLIVERMSLEDARDVFGKCTCGTTGQLTLPESED